MINEVTRSRPIDFPIDLLFMGFGSCSACVTFNSSTDGLSHKATVETVEEHVVVKMKVGRSLVRRFAYAALRGCHGALPVNPGTQHVRKNENSSPHLRPPFI